MKLVRFVMISLLLFPVASFGINIQQFSRSNSLVYEMIEDSRLENSHVYSEYDWLINIGGSFVDTPLSVKDPGNSDQLATVIDEMLGLHFGVSWYAKSYLQIGVQSYFANFETARNGSKSGFGDIDLRAKIRLHQH